MPPKKRPRLTAARSKPIIGGDTNEAGKSLPHVKQHQNNTGSETPNRLHARRLRDQNTRASETPTTRRSRLRAQRLRIRNIRASETSTARRSRLQAQRLRIRNIRASETSTARRSRLQAQRLRIQNIRASETSTARRSRLQAKRLRYRNIRASETPAATQTRIQAQRIRRDIARSSEEPSTRDIRLANLRERSSNYRLSGWASLNNEAFNYNPSISYQSHTEMVIGKMVCVCKFCGAKKFKAETPGMCCSNGKVCLPELSEPPEVLKNYMDNSTYVRKNLRQLNSSFQMTSFGTTRPILIERGFCPTFRIQGQVYHKAGSLLPLEGQEAKFLQIYFMGDEQKELDQRLLNYPGIKRDVLLNLQQMLHLENVYVRDFKTALDQMPNDDMKIVIHADRTPPGEHERRYNTPVLNEVAIVIAGNEFERRDIVLHKRNNQLLRISETHKSYDALQYPLLFPRGEDGYYINIKQVNPITKQTVTKTVSAKDFYAYRIMVRNDSNHILNCRQLFHQFLVDMYAKIESERLLHIRLNQKILRADDYIHLRDAMANDGDPNNQGKLVILPSSFIGGPRNMHEYSQDAMTYIRKYGTPDLFITSTCNPKWQEIRDELLADQNYTDRHDLIARVFRRKYKNIMDTIVKGQIFGKVTCWMYTIEWQKRGLPHGHALIWLARKIQPHEIDHVISAELPDKNEDSTLYDIVLNSMIHGPCGNFNKKSPCMKDGRCTKMFPKDFLNETQSGNDGYPLYRRRSPTDGGYVGKKKIPNSTEMAEVNNRWVVPYSPLLLKMFQCHINVEYCNSVKSIKYICKYVNKGSDQAVFAMEKDGVYINEIDAYQSGRYISSNEAAWRILEFPIHERFPTVVHLSVHLKDGQRIYFTEKNYRQKLSEPPKTTLTAFFQLCEQDNFAKTLLYCDVPQYYTWNNAAKIFSRRKQGAAVEGYPEIRSSGALGRVYTVHFNNFECYYLRLLLHTVAGPTSFDFLKVVDGHMCETYREACQKRGLLEDDQHWARALQEASCSASAAKVRYLYAILLTTCEVSNPMELWNDHKKSMSEDILHQIKLANPTQSIDYNDDIFNRALCLIGDKVITICGKSLDEFGLPKPTRSNDERLQSYYLRETNYDKDLLETYVRMNEPLLVADQKSAYDEILQKVESNAGEMYFLDAAGGTGKTFVINLLLSQLRKRSQIAIAIASSGIAATLLQGGRTAHSTLKLPLDLVNIETPICNISKGTGLAKLLEECKLIVWDECTMMHKNGLEALDRTLRDIRGNNSIMGGAVVVLAGDFRQILPVIPRGTMANELNACMKRSKLWCHVKTLKLTTNMRVHLLQDAEAGQFAEQLLTLGDGRLPYEPKSNTVTLPKTFCHIVDTIEQLEENIFPQLLQNYQNSQWLCERAILSPKNSYVNDINLCLLKKLPGEVTTYKSINVAIDMNDAVKYPTEFLNSLHPSGLPLHELTLKVGAIIMLMRNLDAPRMCNGTRLSIKNLRPNTVEALILTGCAKGEEVFIPRIPMIPTNTPIEFKRLQFPIQLAYAMTINKAQGQSLKIAGIDLRSECFTHGQLYVAASRVGSGKNLYILAPNGKATNIVNRRAL